MSTSKTLMHGALAARLTERGLPWAPSPEAARERAAEAGQPAGALRELARNDLARRAAISVLAIAALVVLWGGYVRGWAWTGFRGMTLWNWYGLLLFPLAVASLRARPSGRSFRPRYKAVIVLAAAGWVVTVLGGYLLAWAWTGYAGNTLWDWLQMLLLPLMFPTVLLPAVLRWVSGHGRKAPKAAANQSPARTRYSGDMYDKVQVGLG